MSTGFRIAALTSLLAFLPASIAAGGAESWSFDVSTTGDDVFWTSPTAVQTDAPRYETVYEITLIEVDVLWLIFDFTIDVTDQVPPELLLSTATFDGPLPITIVDQLVIFPEPPEPTSVSANLAIEIDAAGFGQLAATDVVLGTGTFELPGFGTQTADIERIRVAGTVDVIPRGPLGDLDDDFVVDVKDLLGLLAEWGTCPDPCPPTCAGDLDEDCTVGITDLLIQLANWG